MQVTDEYDHRDEDLNETITSYADDITEYAEHVQNVSEEMPAEKVISTLAGPDFAYQFNRADELRSRQRTLLTADEHEKLDAIVPLLGTLSVFRQYFKTIALHQELAQLSRQFIFVAFPAVVVALLAPLIYKTNPAQVLISNPPTLFMSASLTIVIVPLILVLAYMLRISTIFRYTITVAPFVPPEEWPWSKESE